MTFTIKNLGLPALAGLVIAITGPHAAEFTVTTPPAPSLNEGGSTLFTVQFTPAAAGTRTAALEIASNDGDENPFVINLTGRVLLATEDSDGDGLDDAAEFYYSALGFDWQVSQPGLVSTLFSHANVAGLYTQSQLGALHPGATLLTADPQSGLFKLTIGIDQSTDLLEFSPFPMTEEQISINAGKFEFQFSAPDRAFFRLDIQ